MPRLDLWCGNIAIGCAVIAAYLFACDLFHTPSIFENIRPEAAFCTPMLAWLICRRTFHWTARRW